MVWRRRAENQRAWRGFCVPMLKALKMLLHLIVVTSLDGRDSKTKKLVHKVYKTNKGSIPKQWGKGD